MTRKVDQGSNAMATGAATAYNVMPIRADMYDEAYAALLDAGADWPTMLRCAAILSHSPIPAHTSLARHTFTSHSLHLAGLLKSADPAHRDRSDMIDRWRADALEGKAAETSLQVAARYRDRWPEILLHAVIVIAAVWAVLTGVLSL